MLRIIGKTFGMAIAGMCLVSTLAMAQSQSSSKPTPQPPPDMKYQDQAQAQPRTMTCMKDDGKGNCVAAAGEDGRMVVVVGENMKTGAQMTCVDTGTIVKCEKA